MNPNLITLDSCSCVCEISEIYRSRRCHKYLVELERLIFHKNRHNLDLREQQAQIL